MRQTAPTAGAMPVTRDRTVDLHDFVAYMPMHNYVFLENRETWPASSVDARIPPVQVGIDDNGKPIRIKASRWLDQNSPVEQMTWAPGEPLLIPDRLISQGGWIKRDGCTVLNLYRPPELPPGDPTKAKLWREHVKKIYPKEADHIIDWCAFRVQFPGDKINHALVLGGAQGIGKDTLLEPVKAAVGPWNVAEVSPAQLLGRFNGFLKCVILRVSEAHDLGDIDRYAFYDRMKAYTAAPPDVLRCDEKHLREYHILNVCGVILTTNHKTDGLYLPADDRRHFVAWSDLTKDDFDDGYWSRLYHWYDTGGLRDVATFLAEHDVSEFDPKAPPPKTPAFWDIVDTSRAPEDAELADLLDKIDRPEATCLSRLVALAEPDLRDWLRDRKNRRRIPHRMESVGYVPVRNDGAQSDGHWKVDEKRQAIYAKRELCERDRIAAAQALSGR